MANVGAAFLESVEHLFEETVIPLLLVALRLAAEIWAMQEVQNLEHQVRRRGASLEPRIRALVEAGHAAYLNVSYEIDYEGPTGSEGPTHVRLVDVDVSRRDVNEDRTERTFEVEDFLRMFAGGSRSRRHLTSSRLVLDPADARTERLRRAYEDSVTEIAEMYLWMTRVVTREGASSSMIQTVREMQRLADQFGDINDATYMRRLKGDLRVAGLSAGQVRQILALLRTRARR